MEQGPGLSLRKGLWKLIPPRKGPAELYDLARDLGETKNVAAANPRVVEEMTALLEKIRAGVIAPVR